VAVAPPGTSAEARRISIEFLMTKSWKIQMTKSKCQIKSKVQMTKYGTATPLTLALSPKGRGDTTDKHSDELCLL